MSLSEEERRHIEEEERVRAEARLRAEAQARSKLEAEGEVKRQAEEATKKEADKKVQQKVQAGCFGCLGLIVLLVAIGYLASLFESPAEKAWKEYKLARDNHEASERAYAKELCAPAYQLARRIVGDEMKPESEWCAMQVRTHVAEAMAKWDAEHPAPAKPGEPQSPPAKQAQSPVAKKTSPYPKTVLDRCMAESDGAQDEQRAIIQCFANAPDLPEEERERNRKLLRAFDAIDADSRSR